MEYAVAYMRVSTHEQGKSGLGLEAQQAEIAAFAAKEDFEIIEWFMEVESGKTISDTLEERPQLAAALALGEARKCPVVVAKLDRLSRDVHFISGLMKKDRSFIVTQFGRGTDTFMLHLYAAFAEQERKVIGQRTRAGLAAAKARGTQLGSPNPKAGGEANRKRWAAIRAAKASKQGDKS